MRPGFRFTDGEDPHHERRRAILRAHPEVRRLFGPDWRTVPWTVAVVAAQLVVAALLARHRAGPGAIAALAWIGGGFAAKFCGVAIHEAAHDLVFGKRTANRLFALVANLPLVAPGAMAFRRLHHQHHNRIGQVGVDNDLPSPEELRWRPGTWVGKLLWLALFPIVVTPARARHFTGRPNRWELVNIAVQLAAGVAIGLLGGWRALAYLGLSSLFGYGLHPVSTHMLHEHAADDSDRETWSYYGALNHLTLHLGCHVEHHDFQNIPGARLPDLRRIAPELYERAIAGRSWPAIFWRFLRRPEVGYHQRIARRPAR